MNEFKVEQFLKHIKQYFDCYSLNNERSLPSLSKEFLMAEDIYLHSSDISNKDDILQKGLLLEKTSPRIRYIKPEFEDGVIFVANYFNGNLPIEIKEVVVFVIDTQGLNPKVSDNCSDDFYIFNNVNTDKILGWFSYFPRDYSQGVKTSIDEASETQQIG